MRVPGHPERSCLGQRTVADLDQMHVGEVLFGQRLEEPEVDRRRIGLLHVVERITRRQSDTGSVGADDISDRGDDFDREADPVLQRAAVRIGAQVGVVGEELVDQVAVGTVELHPVEAGVDGVASRGGESTTVALMSWIVIARGTGARASRRG